jgi:outer membrane autotransporter protein
MWAAGYGGSQITDGNVAVGSNGNTGHIYGGAAGFDYRFSPNTVAGLSLGGAGSNFNLANGLGGGRSEIFQAGAYGRHSLGAAYLAGALAYGWHDVTTDRTALSNHLHANFDANSISGRLEGGYRAATGMVGLTPYAAGQFTTLFLPNYAEQAVVGVNTFALAYAGRDISAPRSELGLRTDASFATWNAIVTLRGRAGWAHNFSTDRVAAAAFQTLPAASFVVNGAAQAREAALLAVSAETRWANGFSVAATFDGEFSRGTESYIGKGLLRYQW